MLRTKWFKTAVVLMLAALLITGCGGAKPQPGAVFAGTLEPGAAGDNASIAGGDLEFTIAGDGAGIATVTYALKDMTCSIASGGVMITSEGWSSTMEAVQPIIIEGGSFEVNMGDITLKGKFSSATEARGTMKVKTTTFDSTLGRSYTCDYGVLNWSAQMKQRGWRRLGSFLALTRPFARRCPRPQQKRPA